MNGTVVFGEQLQASAQRVKDAAKQLNVAIDEAAKLGIVTEVELTNVTIRERRLIPMVGILVQTRMAI